MPAIFLDTSALVKRYVAERGSDTVESLVRSHAGDIFIATLTEVEMTSAVIRRVRGGFLARDAASATLAAFHLHLEAEYRTVRITRRVVRLGAELAEKYGLRGYDAVQLACAATLRANDRTPAQMAVTLVSADAELNAAAGLEGFEVVDPNTDGSL